MKFPISNVLESTKSPFSSTAAVKLQKDNQNSNRKEMRPMPTLNLAFNPETKELYLQLNDKKSLNGSEKSSSSQQGSGFCSLCNATPCKFQNNSSGNDVSVEGRSNTMIITVSKNDLCRTICNDSGEASSTSSSQKDRDGEYCSLCNAPKCKLKDTNEVSRIGQRSNDSTTKEDTSTQKVKNSEYCHLCDAPKCKLKDNNEVSTDGERSNDNRTKEVQNTDTSDFIDIIVSKTEICRQICNAGEIFSSRRTEDTKSGSPGNKDDDITKSPDYCSVCSLPICKFETARRTQNATESHKAIEYKTSSNSTPGSSDYITISVDKSDLCRHICQEEQTLTKTTPTENKDDSYGERRQNKR